MIGDKVHQKEGNKHELGWAVKLAIGPRPSHVIPNAWSDLAYNSIISALSSYPDGTVWYNRNAEHG